MVSILAFSCSFTRRFRRPIEACSRPRAVSLVSYKGGSTKPRLPNRFVERYSFISVTPWRMQSSEQAVLVGHSGITWVSSAASNERSEGKVGLGLAG